MKLNTPSKDDMKRVDRLWDEQNKFAYYGLNGMALKLLFKSFPHNTNASEVALKVACLDTFYSTNATKKVKIPQIAAKIVSIKDFDKRVQGFDERLVVELASFERAKLYSFASKYCTLHNELVHKRSDFAIYDSLVCEKLKEFRKAYKGKCAFAEFKSGELYGVENYGKFREILRQFIADFELNCSLREPDSYFWKMGKLGE